MYSGSSDLHGSYSSEQINLGSPMAIGSPNSPSMGHAGHSSQYLPGYLLGDTVSHAVSPGARMWSGGSQSPQKADRRGHISPTSPAHISAATRSDLVRTKEKVAAPPVKSLFDHVSSPIPSGTPYTPGGRQVSLTSSSRRSPATGNLPVTPGLQCAGTPSNMGAGNISLGPEQIYTQKLQQSPAQIDPFYTQGEAITSEDVLDETWITVFGFPPAAASFILQQFSQYGNIIKHVMTPEGNWMHLHYQSKIQAKKALSKNGKVYGGGIMVGVAPCIDKTVMENEKENSYLQQQTMLSSTPLSGTGSEMNTSSRNTPIRPLTAAYKAARSEQEVVSSGQVPQKSTNFVSKAMDYVFGW